MQAIVVRPSERAASAEGKLSFTSIREKRIAPGFSSSPGRVEKCGWIIVVRDDARELFCAKILKTEESPSDSQKRRTTIYFGVPSMVEDQRLIEKILAIKWTSNNVRYLDVGNSFASRNSS